ncbi:pectate lyase superfamily protein-domain-containing protein [Aspergillus nidulans var. acristatus]
MPKEAPAIPKGDHEQVAADIRRKYSLRTNDANVPPQRLRQADGLTGSVDSWEDRAVSSINESSAETTETKAKRETNTYGMTTIEQRGQSPFAPKGYKAWRNAMDYGSKGDGVTDDTVAISKAVSDGGRCGSNCDSSTIYPAVVYFPRGMYLISRSIIQYYNTQFLGDPVTVPTILAGPALSALGRLLQTSM